MNFFDHKDLGNNLLQQCPQVMKHPVYTHISTFLTKHCYSVIMNHWFSLSH